jgi:Protein of unknown function (DUF3995)
MFAVWAAVALKAIAALLPLVVIGALHRPPRRWERWLRRLTWIEALILTAYGLVLTATGLLVQSAVIAPPRNADHRALRWHAYLWDPWFLVRVCSSPLPWYRAAGDADNAPRRAADPLPVIVFAA